MFVRRLDEAAKASTMVGRDPGCLVQRQVTDLQRSSIALCDQ
jgi:hypothetical protein